MTLNFLSIIGFKVLSSKWGKTSFLKFSINLDLNSSDLDLNVVKIKLILFYKNGAKLKLATYPPDNNPY